MHHTKWFHTASTAGLNIVLHCNCIRFINEEFVIKSDINKTITVLNPNNQLLIDTNYDGIYESGVTEYSSFEIRLDSIAQPYFWRVRYFKFQTIYQID
jgi:hypothetical protein